MSKQIIFHEEAKRKMLQGISTVAKTVGITIGPFGRNVALRNQYGSPTITNDGVSITREITLSDKFEDLGAQIIKEVAQKTNDTAGDGTSTSIILTYSLIKEGLNQLNRGVNPLSIRGGMNKAHRRVVEELKKVKRNIETDEEIAQIAAVSAESKKYGDIIAEVVKKVGKRGVITVEESQSTEIEREVVEGLEIDKGYISPYMVTNPERQIAEYKNIPVLITDEKISTMREILPLLEKLVKGGQKELFIIAEDVDGEALTTFVLNKLKGTLNVLAVKAPSFGDRKKDVLGDIAATVGAKVVTKDIGMKLENAELDVLGNASSVTSKKDKTVIVGSSEYKQRIEERINSINSDDDFNKERIAKLSGGVAVIRVGAPTESEMKYLKLKIEDAVSATKAALEEGVIVGGGCAFAHIANKLRKENIKFSNQDEKKGFNIVLSSIELPFKKIVKNTLADDYAYIKVVRKILNEEDTFGYDALKKEFVEDMFKEGIIDPLKVARAALENSISAAGIFLTTEAAIVDEGEETGV